MKCLDCPHLDKSIKQSYGKAYRYGCNLRPEGFVLVWINTDAFLSQIGCKYEGSMIDEEDYSEESNSEEIRQEEVTEARQMTIDEWLRL